MSKRNRSQRQRNKEDLALDWILGFRSSKDKPKGFWNERVAIKFVKVLQSKGNIHKAAKAVGISVMTSRFFVTELKQAAEKGMRLREYIRKGRPFRSGAKTYGKGDKK